MTNEERRAAILKAMEAYAVANTVSKAAARASLVRAGIHTKEGKLRVALGGEPRKSGKAG